MKLHFNFHFASRLLVAGLLILLAACSNQTQPETTNPLLTVYKSPTCGCCTKWIDHMNEAGFVSNTHHPKDLNEIKQLNSVPPRYQSCHTAVIDDYVFEGHVPAAVIQRFLAEKPRDVLGLTVPGMPMGSPGMDMGNHKEDYDVFQIHKDGSVSVYQHVDAHSSDNVI